MNFLKIKAMIMNTTMANIDLIMCHLNSSRCSRNDISFSPFFPFFPNIAINEILTRFKIQPVKMINLPLQNNIYLLVLGWKYPCIKSFEY
jgi:hypothetical protein